MGTAVREENILLLVWLVAMRRIGLAPGLAVLAAAGAWIVALRWWLLAGLPGYTWEPSWWSFTHNLKDLRSMASVCLTGLVVLPLALAAWRKAPPALGQFRSLLLLMALPPLYAALCVRIDGRAVWGLYPFLIPLAVSLGAGRRLKTVAGGAAARERDAMRVS